MDPIHTIAIIDDDDGVRASLSSLVRSLGYGVRTYATARDFLDERTAAAPACVITDVQMPAMDGEQLQSTLRAAGRAIPMVFITAFPNEALRARVMAAGASAFLEKPVDASAVARCLAAALGGEPA